MLLVKCPMCRQAVNLPADCARYWCGWDSDDWGRQVHLFRVGRGYEEEKRGSFRTKQRLELALNEICTAVDVQAS